MSNDQAFDKLRDGKTYKVYRKPGFGNWLAGMAYKVVDPKGDHVSYAYTLRGAQRAIAVDRAAPKPREWWEQEIVAEVPK